MRIIKRINMDCFAQKIVQCRIVLLDKREFMHDALNCETGQAILDVVFAYLNLGEKKYFGLRYLHADDEALHWLDPLKKLCYQLPETGICTLFFGIKFYTGDPCKLSDDKTRYQFFLQIRKDMYEGRLPVNFDYASELSALVLQTELGDYDSVRHTTGYVSKFRLVPKMSVELEFKICLLHRNMVGQLPAISEMKYLDKVKWLDMYGIELHPILEADNGEYFLGLTPSGIVIVKNKARIKKYYWPNVFKIRYRGRYIKIRVANFNNEKRTYIFETPSNRACKYLWKCCVECRRFFKKNRAVPIPANIPEFANQLRKKEEESIDDNKLLSRAPLLFTQLQPQTSGTQPSGSRQLQSQFSRMRNNCFFMAKTKIDVICQTEISIPPFLFSCPKRGFSIDIQSSNESLSCKRDGHCTRASFDFYKSYKQKQHLLEENETVYVNKWYTDKYEKRVELGGIDTELNLHEMPQSNPGKQIKIRYLNKDNLFLSSTPVLSHSHKVQIPETKDDFYLNPFTNKQFVKMSILPTTNQILTKALDTTPASDISNDAQQKKKHVTFGSCAVYDSSGTSVKEHSDGEHGNADSLGVCKEHNNPGLEGEQYCDDGNEKAGNVTKNTWF